MMQINLVNLHLIIYQCILKDPLLFYFSTSQLLSAALEHYDILFRQQAYPDQDHGLGAYHTHLYHTLTDFFKNDCFRSVSPSSG